jgi:hypothetical protein
MHTGSNSSGSSSKEDACAARLQAIAEEAHTHWLTTSAHRALAATDTTTAGTTAAGTTAAGPVRGHSAISTAQSDIDANSCTAEFAAQSSSSSSSTRASSDSSHNSHNGGVGVNGNGNGNGHSNGNSVQLYRRQKTPVITQFKLLLARSWRQVQPADTTASINIITAAIPLLAARLPA